MGFLGKQAVHPRQLEIIQRCFLPTDHGELRPSFRTINPAAAFCF
jgi:citrate lyase beta subunit